VKPATRRRPGRPRKVFIKRTGRPRGLFTGPEFRIPLYRSGNPPGRPRKGEPSKKAFSFMPDKFVIGESSAVSEGGTSIDCTPLSDEEYE
jgi:hypothetical protein